MGRIYSATFDNVTVTNASGTQDWFELAPGTQKPVKVHAIFISQSSDVGDAAEEILRYKVIRGHTTSGSGGTTVVPPPADGNDTAAADSTLEVNNTTIASAGTAVDLHSEAFNIRVGLQLIFTPEMRPRVENAELLVVRMMSTVVDDLSMNGTIYFEEL